jgi:hypothetical protein
LNKTTPLEAIGMVESVEQIDTGQLPDTPAKRTDLEEGERAQFRQELLRDSNEDLSAFGMQVVSVSLQKIWDTSNYIANLANKSLARKRQDIDVQEARLTALAETSESDSVRRREIARNKADERIVESREDLEVTRRLCQAEIERARLEADGAISKAQSEGERHVQQAMIELQKLRNVSEVTLLAEFQQQAAEVLADGEGQAIQIVEGTRNELLQMKADLVAKSGDAGRIAFFVQQHLPALFQAYQEHAANVRLDSIVAMDDHDGLDHVINRGPRGMAKFLEHFHQSFGIDVRRLLSTSNTNTAKHEG